MSHKAIKIGVTALVLATAFAALLFTTLQDNLQYYKYVDEVVASPHEWEGKTMQVHSRSSFALPFDIGGLDTYVLAVAAFGFAASFAP